MQCIVDSCSTCIPVKKHGVDRKYNVPGWNDLVQDKHSLAREAFLNWVAAGRPRQGPVFYLMRKHVLLLN